MTADASYVAAWPDAHSCVVLELAGVTKRVHLTTCFDKSGGLRTSPFQVDLDGATARIVALEEWTTRKGRHVVALLDGCEWAHKINAEYQRVGFGEKRAFRPHITLAKRVEPGAAQRFQFLIGHTLRFDRHGFE